MKHGDFTELAKDCIHRPGYGLRALRAVGPTSARIGRGAILDPLDSRMFG